MSTTTHPEPLPAPATDAPARTTSMSFLSKNLDRGHKGFLTPLEQALRKYDTNNDGTYSQDEVRQVVEDLDKVRVAKEGAQRQASLATKGFLVLAGVLAFMCTAMLAITLGANEMSKESHVQGGKMVDKTSGSPVATAMACETGGILSIPLQGMEANRRLDEVAFPVLAPRSSAQELTMMEVLMRVSVIHRHIDGTTPVATVKGWGGERLVVNGTAATYYSGGDNGSHDASQQPSCANGCRVLLNQQEQQGRRLSSWGGALMTSGSFTMMASAAGG